MLTSFGLGVPRSKPTIARRPLPDEMTLRFALASVLGSVKDSGQARVFAQDHYHPGDETLATNPFYGMPPVSMRDVNGPFFLPDYNTLLLADQVVLDKASFTALQWEHHRSYAVVADAMQSLEADGFVELADCGAILNDNRSLLAQMLESDLDAIERWERPLAESVGVWKRFITQAGTLLDDNVREERPALGVQFLHFGSHAETHTRSISIPDTSDRLRQTLTPYLAYVNANIVLSNELGVGFHDWMDYAPFYRTKFLAVGREDVEHQQVSSEAVHTLFRLAFPDFAIHDARSFIKIVKDKRIVNLRAKIQDAVDGKVQFDQDFARTTLLDVLNLERRSAQYRHVTFFLTLPLHFIPLVGAAVHKVAEEAVDSVLERKLRRPNQWFYLLSDISESAHAETQH
jgi:hypothetical protein